MIEFVVDFDCRVWDDNEPVFVFYDKGFNVAMHPDLRIAIEDFVHHVDPRQPGRKT
jgi:hypothetical protein